MNRTRIAANDWDAWCIFADQLSEQGDGRGALLLLERERLDANLDPGDDAAMRELIGEQIDQWMAEHGDALGEEGIFAVETYALHREDFDAIAHLAPSALKDAMALEVSQVLAIADGKGVAVRCVEAIDAAVIAWIETAFDGVPPPGPDNLTLRQAEAADSYAFADRQPGESEGPWQDVVDDYLLEHQWALPHLDAQGIRYYLPAVMRIL